MAPRKKSLGQVIDARLNELGVSKREAARDMGISDASLVRYTSGWSAPNAATVKILARWLGMPLADVRKLADDAKIEKTSTGAAQKRLIEDMQRTVDRHKRLLDRYERDFETMRADVTAIKTHLGLG